MATEVYGGKYGTFLGNCERDREQLKLEERTESIWTYVLLERERFTNKFYSPTTTQDVIEQIPVTAHFALKEWREFHFKWTTRGYDSYNQEVNRAFLHENCGRAIQSLNLKEKRDDLKALLIDQLKVLARLEE